MRIWGVNGVNFRFFIDFMLLLVFLFAVVFTNFALSRYLVPRLISPSSPDRRLIQYIMVSPGVHIKNRMTMGERHEHGKNPCAYKGVSTESISVFSSTAAKYTLLNFCSAIINAHTVYTLIVMLHNLYVYSGQSRAGPVGPGPFYRLGPARSKIEMLTARPDRNKSVLSG